jgi:hypothetical protein
MKTLPYDRFIIRTKLTPDEVQQRISGFVEPDQWFRWFSSGEHKPYQGEIENHKFRISRAIHYRNSFLPIIIGEIQSDPGGSTIRITMRMHGLVIAFMIFWLGNVGYLVIDTIGSVLLTTLKISSNEATPSGILFGIVFFTFGYLMAFLGYKFEAIKSINYLCDVLRARDFVESGIMGLGDVQATVVILMTIVLAILLSMCGKILL